MNIRTVIERLRKIYLDEHSEDFTKCELMENILRSYQSKVAQNIEAKFDKNIFTYANNSFNTILRNRLNAIVNLVNQSIEGLIDEPCINVFVCYENIEIVVEDNILTTDDNKTISQSAYEDSYFTCEECANIFHNDEQRTFYENEHDYYCTDCLNSDAEYCDYHDDYHHQDYTCNEGRRNNLDAYEERVFLHFLGKVVSSLGVNHAKYLVDSVLFYGIEVELHVRHDDYSRSEVVDIFREAMNDPNEEDFILCKRDGSLHPEYGFEVVSTNCTFDYHKKHFWNKFFKLNPNKMVKAYHGYNCGIHIHFSRNAFTENQLKRLNVFYNNPKNRSLILDIAGREPNGYCQFQSYVDFNSSVHRGERYSVMNVNNSDTIEIRIFRSNIKPISFFRYLEFVHTVNLWITSNQKNNADNLSVNDYFDWLLKNVHKDFANLLIFLDDKQHFEHLKHIESWKQVYLNFKEIVHDFRINNSELINQELESEV